jgi:DNA primase small subunit
MQRHLAFRKSSELVHFLTGKKKTKLKLKIDQRQTKVPAHVYYSSAYYSDPGLQPMQAKVEGWLGADLIFDLDDDHLRNIEGLSPEERLKKVKDIVKFKLLDDFILGDFGFDEKNVKIAFSGSRGYHIHVNDPKVFLMTSAERRELVDYLIGIGLNMDRIFPNEVFETKEYGGRKYSKKPKIITPKLDSSGWKGRMARGIFELIIKISNLPVDEGLDELLRLCKDLKHKGKSIPLKDVEAIYNELFLRTNLRMNKKTFEQRNILEIFSKDTLRDIFLKIVREHQKVEMAGETDEPVTTDVKRLIRLPTSLHGKTGFRVVPLTIDELSSFNPFRDAIAFGSEPVKIKCLTQEDFKFRLKVEEFSIHQSSGIIELPEFAAIYLMCQRKAEIAQKK